METNTRVRTRTYTHTNTWHLPTNTTSSANHRQQIIETNTKQSDTSTTHGIHRPICGKQPKQTSLAPEEEDTSEDVET